MRDDPPRPTRRPLLDEQLRLLRDRRADVADLLELGIEHDGELGGRIANDLGGARLVIRAARAPPSPVGASCARREEFERREREAGDLLRAVLAAP